MMKYNPNIHHRRSIRLKGYDYSQTGLYFITICTQNRKHLFGKMVFVGADLRVCPNIPNIPNIPNMQLNDAGQMIEKWYYELENKFPDIKCGKMVIMPNHFHFIFENVGCTVLAKQCVCPNTKKYSPMMGEYTISGEHVDSPLHRVLQWFKTMTANEYIRGVKNENWKRFDRKLWQRNYWEHIIRDENEFMRISEYIKNNPKNWKKDKLNGGKGNVVMESSTPYNEENWMV